MKEYCPFNLCMCYYPYMGIELLKFKALDACFVSAMCHS